MKKAIVLVNVGFGEYNGADITKARGKITLQQQR